MRYGAQLLGAVLLIGAGVLIGSSGHTPPVKSETPKPREIITETVAATEDASRRPDGASDADSDAMRRAVALEEECRGGQHSPDDPTCRSRDQAFAALEKRNWCWAYSDWRVVAADADWHRCEVTHPAGWKPDPAFGSAAEPAVDIDRIDDEQFITWLTGSPGVASDTQPERRPAIIKAQRESSASLRRFEKLSVPYNENIGTLMAIDQCHLRGDQWASAVNDRIRAEAKKDPALTTLRASLSEAELEAALAYNYYVMIQHASFLLGERRTQGCAFVASAPFLDRFDRYERGDLASLL